MRKLLKLFAIGFVSIGILAACDGEIEDPDGVNDPAVNDPAVEDPAVGDEGL